MENSQINEFIRDQTKLGKSREQIHDELLRAGWDAATIEASFNGGPVGELPGPIELLKQAWGIFKTQWKTVVPVTLIPAFIIGAVIVGLLIAAGLAFGLGAVMAGEKFNPTGLLLVGLIGGGIIFYIIVLIFALWMRLAILAAVSGYREKITIGQSFSVAWRKLWPFFVTSFIAGVITFAGFAFFIIPGIILSVWFAFYAFVVIKEDKKWLEALLTSRGYVRGFGWEVAWRFIALFLVNIGIAIVYFILIGLFGVFTGSDNKEAASTGVFLLLPIQIAYYVVQFVMNILGIIYSYLIYEKLRALKGGSVDIAPSTKKKYILFGALGFVFSLIVWGMLVLGVAYILSNAGDKIKNLSDKNDEYSQMSNKINMELAAVGVWADIMEYYTANESYPESLRDLGEEYRDTGTSDQIIDQFDYTLSDDGTDFSLCPAGELDETNCYTSQGKMVEELPEE